MTDAPIPTMLSLPTLTPPAKLTPGHICAPSLIMHSWSILDEVLTITPTPIFTPAWITELEKITLPLLTFEEGETIADEWIKLGILKLFFSNSSKYSNLFLLLPIATIALLNLFLISFCEMQFVFPKIGHPNTNKSSPSSL